MESRSGLFGSQVNVLGIISYEFSSNLETGHKSSNIVLIVLYSFITGCLINFLLLLLFNFTVGFIFQCLIIIISLRFLLALFECYTLLDGIRYF